MSDANQAATNPVNGQGTPAPESVGEQASEPTIEDTLKQYAEETKKVEPAPQPPQPGEQQPPAETGTQVPPFDPARLKRLEAVATKMETRDFQDAMKHATKKMRDVGGDALNVYDDQTLEDILNGAARRDVRIVTAFSQMDVNPGGWNDVIAAVGRGAAQRASEVPDPGLTADRVTARTSGQGISPTTGEKTDSWNDDWNSISEEERLKRMREHGHDPNNQFII